MMFMMVYKNAKMLMIVHKNVIKKTATATATATATTKPKLISSHLDHKNVITIVHKNVIKKQKQQNLS